MHEEYVNALHVNIRSILPVTKNQKMIVLRDKDQKERMPCKELKYYN